MGFIAKLLGIGKRSRIQEEPSEEDWEQLQLNRRETDFHNEKQREQYISCCLSQKKDAETELNQLQYEYDLVTASLKDTEEIDALGDPFRQQVIDYATKLNNLASERQTSESLAAQMTEEQYHHMDVMRDEMPKGYEKLKKAEEYQALVKSDLKKLENEKQAYLYRKEELKDMKYQIKGILAIALTAAVLCLILLLVLQFVFTFDVKVGYLLLSLCTAIVISVCGLKYLDAGSEEKRVAMSLCKLITMQNTVKIRYVNNTHLLDYLYVKFFVSSAFELSRLWELYLKEYARREKMMQNKEDHDFYYKELLRILSRMGLHDTSAWMHRLNALMDPREMVEARHSLIIRRQKLRKQMDYNKETAQTADDEVKSLLEQYPEYASHIIRLIEKFG